jgi:hypothetical protein
MKGGGILAQENKTGTQKQRVITRVKGFFI